MDRDDFIRRWRSRAAALGLEPRPVEVTRERLDTADITGQMRLGVAVVSLGNSEEAHGPALAPDIDDRTGTVVAARVAARSGARYLGHAPFAGDGIGDIAAAWSPAYRSDDDLVDALTGFLEHLLEAFYDVASRPRPELLVFLSGHGGNAALEPHLERIAARLRVGRCAYALAFVPPPGAPMDAQHAADGEHSIAAALGPGAFSRAALEAQNAALADDAGFIRMVCAHPALGGMAGYYLFGDEAFEAVRARYAGVKSSVARLADRRRIDVDPHLGQAALDASVDALSEWIVAMAEERGLAGPRDMAASPTEGGQP